jgi:tetratricopeptide (TPR) repeat protein
MQFRLTRLAVLALTVSIGAAGCGKYSISNIRALKAFQDANNLYKKSDYKAAAERYGDAVRFNPDLGFAYFFLGNSYDNMFKPARRGEPENDANLQKAAENYRLAIEKLRNATSEKEQEIRKRSYEYLIALYGKDKLNDFSKAEPLAQEMIAADPNDPANYRQLGSLYEEQGRMEEAEAQFKKSISMRPNDAIGYQVLAGFYNRQGEFEKTMDAFNQRALIEPNNPEAWHTIATFYQDKVFQHKALPRDKQMEYVLKGIEASDKALAINSEYFEAVSYKNILLRMRANLERDPALQKKLIQEADVLYDKAIALQKKQNQGAGSGPAKKGK